jgi:universal stress protein A
MKIKRAARRGKVLLELGSKDETLLKPLPSRLGRILVPMDFSDTAKKALQYAVPFAGAFDAELVVVHVIQPLSVPPDVGYTPPELTGSEQELRKSAQDALSKLCAKQLGARGRFQVQVRTGVPWHEVVTAAQETAADLIILATHGRTGLKHVLLGSVAESVVRYAPCPVLVVRERERDFITAPSKEA